MVNAALLCSVGLIGSAVINSQDISIRMINGKNGKTIADECLNVWIGGWRGAHLLALTDKQGTLVVHLQNGFVNTDAMPPKACNGMGAGATGPISVPPGANSINLVSNWQISCEERRHPASGEPVDLDLMTNQYAIRRILEAGLAASNTCGKIRIKPSPSELIIFVRPPTFWENMRR